MGAEETRDDTGPVRELRVALTVDDFAAALAFYRDALGLRQVADWSSPDGRVVVLAAGGRRSSCSTRRRPRPSTPSRSAGASAGRFGSRSRSWIPRRRPTGWRPPGPNGSA